MNKPFEELIAKYLEGTLKEDEKKLFAGMLNDPENQLYLASKIDEQFADESLNEIVDEEIIKEIFQRIKPRLNDHFGQQTQTQAIHQPVKIAQLAWHKRKMFRVAVAVAASVLLVITLGITLFTNKTTNKKITSLQNKNTYTDSTSTFIHHEANTSGKEKRIQLPDGSLTVLADKSAITYKEPFTDKREIVLTGKAYFKVSKDKSRPFTVISGEISTTALGTEFTVTASNEHRIIVRLYEGKVVVKSVNKGNLKLKHDVFLMPGQAFVYTTEIPVAVKKFKIKNSNSPEEVMHQELERDIPSIPENTEGSWYMFNNQTLEQVFDQLAAMFGVQIVYNKADIQNIYFTGKYNTSDSLENILKEIATLHNLTITKKDNSFIVSK